MGRNLFDVIIVGGGPAGLNAAIVLGRSNRRVLLFDAGSQRNLASEGMHNYLTRDNIKPVDFIKESRKEAKKYGVILVNRIVKDAERLPGNYFKITDEDKQLYHAKYLLLATGLEDTIPSVEGFKELYGKSVFHCPYCDGWEVNNKKIGLYASRKNGFDLAIALRSWSKDIIYFTDGRKNLKPKEREILLAYKIPVIDTKITRLNAIKGKLKSVQLINGKAIERDALFFVNGYTQQSILIERLGCVLSSKKVVLTNRQQQTNVPGVYVAGDASRDMHFVVVAAAEGAKAGVTINKALQLTEKIAFLQQKKLPVLT